MGCCVCPGLWQAQVWDAHARCSQALCLSLTLADSLTHTWHAGGFWVCGVLLGYLLCFHANMGVAGLWWGIASGDTVTGVYGGPVVHGVGGVRG